MSAPKRIQRKRTRGFRLPPNTVCVDRTSRYGNPYRVQKRGQFWDVLYPNLDGGWDIDRTFRDEHNGEADARELAVAEFEWHLR